jgi:hypothetical protein
MIFLAYGLPGMGKTTLMHDRIRTAPEGHRFFIVDRADEWIPEAIHWRGFPPKNMVVIDGLKNLPDLNNPGVYVFRECEGLQVADLVCQVGNAVYVDDEIDLVARKENWLESPLRKIVHQGRHLRNNAGDITECHILGACRRPQSLHTDVSEQASAVWIFRIQGTRTLGRLLTDSHIEDNEWDIVRNFPKYRYKEWPSGLFFDLDPIGPDIPVSTDIPEPKNNPKKEPYQF